MEMCSADHHSLQREQKTYILFYAVSSFVIKNRPSVVNAILGSLDGICSLIE